MSFRNGFKNQNKTWRAENGLQETELIVKEAKKALVFFQEAL